MQPSSQDNNNNNSENSIVLDELLIDFYNGIGLILSKNAWRLIKSYIIIPAGIIVILLFLYGVNRIILVTTISFPASVVCMLLLFFVLLALNRFAGSKRTATISRVLDVPLGFSLRWINTFFTPSFVLLPLSPAVGGKEVGKIAAVFVIGFVLMHIFTAYMIVGLQKLFKVSKRAMVERAEEIPSQTDHSENLDQSKSLDSSLPVLESIELNDLSVTDGRLEHSDTGIGPSASALEIPRPAATRASVRSSKIDPRDSDSMTSQDRFNVEIDSDLASMADNESDRGLDVIPTHGSHFFDTESNSSNYKGPQQGNQGNDTEPYAYSRKSVSEISNEESGDRLSTPITSKFLKSPLLSWTSLVKYPYIGSPSKRSELFAALATQYLDTSIYIFVFFTVGIPVFFVTGYTLIAHSTFTVLMLFIGLKLPAKVRRFIHPIFTCSGFTILGIYVLQLARHSSLDDGLNAYSTGKTYLNLFGVAEYKGVLPGAGDLLKTLLDVSIVSLAMPMYRYRGDLKKYFLVIIIPNIVVAFITFFAYPPICYAIGISAERSIAFIGRSVTLALALPVVRSLGGSESLVAVIAILSGIVGVLIGFQILTWIKIRDDDYLTRGITTGISASAVGTAHLLTVDPRASALSSLSFVVYGTTLVVLSAISPLAKVMRHMVGLE
ncbi:LrgB-like family-domain-containing protein [Dipodascopsis uninucleata]